MENLSEILQSIVRYCAEFGTIIAEIFGVVVLVITTVKGIILYFRKDRTLKMHLAAGTSIALEFMLGGEVLHTLVARFSWTNIGILGCTIAFHVILTVLLHWEMKNEKAMDETDQSAE